MYRSKRPSHVNATSKIVDLSPFCPCSPRSPRTLMVRRKQRNERFAQALEKIALTQFQSEPVLPLITVMNGGSSSSVDLRLQDNEDELPLIDFSRSCPLNSALRLSSSSSSSCVSCSSGNSLSGISSSVKCYKASSPDSRCCRDTELFAPSPRCVPWPIRLCSKTPRMR